MKYYLCISLALFTIILLVPSSIATELQSIEAITPASTYLNLSNNLFVSSSNVGIGTSSPTYTLHVNGNFYATTVNTGQGNTEVHLMNQNVQTTDSPTFVDLNSIRHIYGDYGTMISSYDEWLRLNDGGTHTNGVYTSGKLRADGGLYVGDDEYWYLGAEDKISTTDTVYIGGYLGVGSSNPVKTLDVRGDAYISGNVGIGTSSPQIKTHIWSGEVASGQQEVLRLEGDWGTTGDGPLLRFTNQHDSGTTPNSGEYNLAGIQGRDFAANWAGGLVFMTPDPGTSGGSALVDRMVIREGGNVGIGTTSPADTLDVNGDVRVRGGDIKDSAGTARITFSGTNVIIRVG